MQLDATPVSGCTGSSGASSSWTSEVTVREFRRFLQAIGEPSTPHVQSPAGRGGPSPELTALPLFFQLTAWQDVGPKQLPPGGAPVEIQGEPPHARSMDGTSDFAVADQVPAGERVHVCSTLTGVECRKGRQGPLHLISHQTTFTDAAGLEVAREEEVLCIQATS